MAGSTSKLTILLEAKNNASSGIKAAEGDLKNLDKAAGNISGGLGALAGAAGIAGIAALGTAAAGAVVDMAKTAAETERLGTAFDNLAEKASSSGESMLAAMQTAAHGTISNAELMASANRAMLLGVADSAGEMAQLLEVAGARGKAMGESTAQAFSDLVTGIGRLSPQILDNLGITIDAEKAYDDYAKQLGVTSQSLDDTQRKQAILNTVIKDSTQLINDNKVAGDDAASNFERMDASLANAKDSLGKLFAPAVAVVAQSIADAASAAATALQEIPQSTRVADLEQTFRTQSDLLADMAANGEEGTLAFQDLTQAAADTKAQIEALGGVFKNAATSSYDLWIAEQKANIATQEAAIAARAAASAKGDEAVKTGMLADKLVELKATADAAAAALNGIKSSAIGALESAASAAVGIMSTPEITRIYSENKKRIQAQVDVMESVGMSTDEIKFKTMELAKEASAPFDIAVEAAREAEKANRKVAGSVDEVSKAYSDLEGKVQSVLSGALDPGVGVNPDDILPRADAINEDARRLADVAVNGFASPWADYFRTAFPDLFQEMAASNDIKQGAALMLRNFQDGLEPELINKDLAKERVRKMLIGDANMAELTKEIATELATEMNIPLSQALQAAQGTLGGGTGLGTSAATEFADGALAGLDEGNGGGAMVSKFIDQARSSYPLLSQAGKDAGKLWGDAFLAVVGDSVPPQLITILTNLITPGVVAQLNQRGSLTGPVP